MYTYIYIYIYIYTVSVHYTFIPPLCLPVALINQLCADGHVTDEEASRLTSSKLFKTPSLPVTDTLPITLNTNENTVHNGIVQVNSKFCSSMSSLMHSSTAANQKVFLASTNEEVSQLTSEKVFKIPSVFAAGTHPIALSANGTTVNDGNVQKCSINGSTSSTMYTATTDPPSDTSVDTVTAHQCELESQLVLNILPNMVVAQPVSPVSDNSHTDDPEDQHTVAMDVTNDVDQLQSLSDHLQKDTETNFTSVTTGIVDEAVNSSINNKPMLNPIVPSEHDTATVEGTKATYYKYA